MRQYTFFPEPLDTVRTSDSEIAVGESILKLLIASPQGAILSTTHGIDSSLLLSERLSGNSSFLSLVQQGRIRFAKWPGGEGPREALQIALSLPEERYRFSGWPELKDDNEIRKLTLEAWKNNISTTGVKALDERIDRARRLYSAIDVAEAQREPIIEKRRADLFADALADAPKWLPPDETSRLVASEVYQLANFDDCNSRSMVYNWIDSRDIDQETNAKLKDLVDARYNKTVADSLGIAFFSLRRVWSNLPGDYHQADAQPSTIELLEPFTEKPFLAPVDWGLIRRSLAVYSTGALSKEDSTEAFGDIVGSITKHKDAMAIGGAGLGLAAGTAVALILRGAVAQWAIVTLTLLAQAIGIGTASKIGSYWGNKVDQRWHGKMIKEYYGWLDSFKSE